MQGKINATIGPYEDDPREEIQKLIPESARKVLDVGCWCGAFGESLKRKGIEVWGIEANRAAAEIAEKRLDYVFAKDLFVALPELTGNKFDVITFNDVLEHLVEPQEALFLCHSLLAPAGKIIACIPNIRYWATIKEILFLQDFRYQDTGILDRTHMRFFTKKSMIRMFEECNYRVVSLKGLEPERIRPFSRFLFSVFTKLTRNKHKDMIHLQYIISAEPKV